MLEKGQISRSSKWSWIAYDWANSAFSTTVMAGFFPVFYNKYYSIDVDPALSTARIGYANSLCSLAVVLSVPLLGAISDVASSKKKFLMTFCVLGVAFTSVLSFVPQGAWFWGLMCYIVAFYFHSAANAFYDALLPEVAGDGEIDTLSSQGYGFGYLGGGILFALNLWMLQSPNTFGLSDKAEAIRYSFLSVGIWWLVFALPLAIWVKEKPPLLSKKTSMPKQVARGLGDLKALVLELRYLKPTLIFLLAFFLYNDGVGTIMKMSIDYGLKIGLKDSDLLSALLLVQFVGFPFALIFGGIAKRFHPKVGIFFSIVVYTILVFVAWKMTKPWEFYSIACGIGMVQGAVQALSRSYYARLIPLERAGEFYGLYNMLGRFIGLIGPWMIAQVVLTTGDHRLSILSISLLFIAGGTLLCFVRENDAKVAIVKLRNMRKQQGA